MNNLHCWIATKAVLKGKRNGETGAKWGKTRFLLFWNVVAPSVYSFIGILFNIAQRRSFQTNRKQNYNGLPQVTQLLILP